MRPPSFPTLPLLLRLWAVALVGAAVLVALSGLGVRSVAATEIVYVEITATPYRCANGDILGSSTACPMAVLNVGPTQTPDPYATVALAGDGREFAVHRGWTYGEVAIASALWLLLGVAGFHVLRAAIVR